MANATCMSCGVALRDLPHTVTTALCAPCDNAHDIAMRTQDLILPCYVCGEDVTFSVVMAATGLTRIAAVFCSEHCSDIDCERNCEELRDATAPEEWEDCDCEGCIAAKRLAEAGTPVLSVIDEDDCPF